MLPDGLASPEELMRGPTGHDERLVPASADPGNLAQHLKRYEFARAYCAGKVVLDVGAGVGYGAAMIAGVARRVYGVDYDASAVRYAAGQYPADTLRFMAADAGQLPFKSGSADVVVSFEVIEHVPDHDRYLAEIARVLKPAGLFLVSTPNTHTASLFRRKAGFRYDAHVSEVGLDQFTSELRRYFGECQIFAMWLRGNRVYGMLRALDCWNLRLRLLPAWGLDFVRTRLFQVPSHAVATDDVIISTQSLRQANHFVAVCRKP